jgi:hypothetical protein
MNLDEAQRKTVGKWVAEGLKLSEIQKRLGTELGITLTYMEARLLVDDLKLVPKDPDPPAPKPDPASSLAGSSPASPPRPPTPEAGPKSGGVSVSVDTVTRPGALVSGKATFSDGVSASWYLDQTGRIGLVPSQPNYRPPASDMQQFQSALETEMAKLGF